MRLHAVAAALVDRLARYAEADASAAGALLEGKAFDKFLAAIARVRAALRVEDRGDFDVTI